MRKTCVAMVLAIFAVCVVALPAAAGRQWCAKDPIVALNGHEVQILVAVPDEMQDAVTGPVNVIVKTPAGVTRELIFTDSGFNGFGETVTFGTRVGAVAADGSFEAQIRVSIPVDLSILAGRNIDITGDTIPMQVTIITGGATVVYEGLSSGMTRVVIVARS